MKFNFAPYNDDFDESANYYKVLFKPGQEVQARELNTIQSILQNQIASVGNHLFKNGSKITGCSSAFVQYDYVRLNDNYNDIPVILKEYNNKSINLVGAVSEVEATIIDVTEKDKDDCPVIFVIYTKTGVDNQQSTFIPGEDLIFKDVNGITVYNATVRCPSCPGNEADVLKPIGKSLFFNIEEGIFYHNGFFVKVHGHHIIAVKYLNKNEIGNIISSETYKVGLLVSEKIVTVLEDDSLYDNHLGYPNEAAPGADRYNISMTLEKRKYEDDDNDESFITLAKVRQNQTVEYKKDDTEYSEIMKELARRTYESSGNFTVIPWKAQFLNERKTINDPTGWSENGSDDKFVATIQPGTGYVKGYRVNTLADTVLSGRKARDTKKLRGAAISFDPRTSIVVTTTNSMSWINHVGSSTLSNQTFNMEDEAGKTIGSFKAYDVIRIDDKTYRIYLYDIVMLKDTKISMIKTIKTVDGSFNATVSDNTQLENSNNNALLFHLGFGSIKSIRDNDNQENGNTSLQLRKRLIGVLDGKGEITFSSQTNETFASPNIEKPICWVGSNPTGQLIKIDNTNVSHTPSTLTIKLGSNNAGKNITYITSVYHTNQQENTKTLTRHVFTTSSKPSNDADSLLQLPHADGYKLVSVQLVSISDKDKNIDITSEYIFDNGQTDNFYKSAQLKRNTLREFDKDDRLIITYYYFEHSGTAGFFTVDSYSQLINDPDLDLEYSDIPVYKDSNGNIHRLAECIDFRTISINNEINNMALIPSFNTTMIFDVEYYLPRSDLLLVNSEGSFYFKEGVSSEKPNLPSIDENSMALYEVHLKAYTYSLDDIQTKYIDNKRFTMKDISKLQSRIENVEYTVALSMLEQQTLNMSTKDVNGLDRYKNGFLVDNFKTYYGVDVTNKEFKASLDRSKGYLRPQFKQRNIKLKADIAKALNIMTFGNMAITKFIDDLFITNVHATQTLSINPYMVFRRTGIMNISPNIDTWSDDKHLPTITSNIDTGVEALRGVADAAKLLGTDYGSWIDYNQTIISSDSKTLVSASDTWRTSVQTINTQTVKTDSTRTITSTSIGSETKSYTIDDIVKDVSIIPYIRENTIQFYATNMKPNTKLYAYFDGQPVSKHCRPINTNQPLFGEADLVTDAEGNINGEFRIPGNTFFTGEKKFVLTNDEFNTGNPDVETTRCESTYFAGGVSQTKQSSTLNVITPTFNRTTTVENKSTTSVNRDVTVQSYLNSSPSVIIDSYSGPNIPEMPSWEGNRADGHFHWMFNGTRWIWDPIAQGFKVEESCFISKVGVYFSNVDENADIIWFEIREMVNGYPSSEGIARHEVKASSLLPFVSSDASKEYQVKFSVPVYVDSSKSYAFVIGGFSPDTRVYISKLGEKLLNQPDKILEQPPLTYTMFRSLNGETWNAEQLTTLKFNMYRCVFDMSGSSIPFYIDEKFSTECDYDPIETISGSKLVKVHVKNHGLKIGDKVVIDFSKENYYRIETTSGIPQIGQKIITSTGTGIIDDVRKDYITQSYEFSLSELEGEILVDQLFTTEAKNFEYRDSIIMESIGAKSPAIIQPESSGKIILIVGDPSQNIIAGIPSSEFTKLHTVKNVNSIDVITIETVTASNFTGRSGGASVVLHGTNIKYDMYNISGQSMSYNAVETWKVNHEIHSSGQLKTEDIFTHADTYMSEPGVIQSPINAKTNRFGANVNITLSSPYISPVFNLDSFSMTAVSNRIDVNDKTIYGSGYIDETDATNGTASFKHVSTKVLLENPAEDIRILFDVSQQNTGDFDVYIKPISAQSSITEDNIQWVKFDKYDKKVSSNNTFIEYDLLASKDCSKWNKDQDFISFRVKLVGHSSNSSRPIIFSNLRVIAIT